LKVHNILQCCQKRTSMWLHATCTENLMKFWQLLSYACGQADIRTDTIITILWFLVGGRVIKNIEIDILNRLGFTVKTLTVELS